MIMSNINFAISISILIYKEFLFRKCWSLIINTI